MAALSLEVNWVRDPDVTSADEKMQIVFMMLLW